LVKLDLGCGTNKKEGFTGVDQYAMPGVDVVLNIGKDPWPWEDDSVDEAHTSHFVEHLNASERIHFCNELHRVLKPGAACTMIVPHWGSCRAYGDLTHQWPPVSEFWFYYLSKEWRAQNAPHNDKQWNPEGYSCDFECTWGYSMNQALQARSPDHQQYAMQWFKESIQDIHANLKKRDAHA
jgi:hypothetical protein